MLLFWVFRFYFFFKSRLVSLPLHNQLLECWFCILTSYSSPSGFVFCIANKALFPAALYFPFCCPWCFLWCLIPANPPSGRSRLGSCSCIYPSAPKLQLWHLTAPQLSVLGSIPLHPATSSCCQATPGQDRNRKAQILLLKHRNKHLPRAQSRRGALGHPGWAKAPEEPSSPSSPACSAEAK